MIYVTICGPNPHRDVFLVNLFHSSSALQWSLIGGQHLVRSYILSLARDPAYGPLNPAPLASKYDITQTMLSHLLLLLVCLRRKKVL